jgi:hypothetical protein
MKRMRRGGRDTLNIYIADLESPKLGWGTFPQDMEIFGLGNDGVVIHTDTLPQDSSAKPRFC